MQGGKLINCLRYMYKDIYRYTLYNVESQFPRRVNSLRAFAAHLELWENNTVVDRVY